MKLFGKNYPLGKLKERLLNNIVGIIVVIFIIYLFARPLATITLDDGIINMSGYLGGIFKVSEIQSVDTVSVYPKIITQRGGRCLGICEGNFGLKNEKQTAKLCLYRNKPPYINIRMRDNSLFILNFKEKDKTMEFYRQLIDALTID